MEILQKRNAEKILDQAFKELNENGFDWASLLVVKPDFTVLK
jgi:hypothetical protein